MKVIVDKTKARRFERSLLSNPMVECHGVRVDGFNIVYDLDIPDFLELPSYATPFQTL